MLDYFFLAWGAVVKNEKASLSYTLPTVPRTQVDCAYKIETNSDDVFGENHTCDR